jgi:transposase-like protein
MKPDNHPPKAQRRLYPDELTQEAVQMRLDGHAATAVVRNLGLRHTSLLYRWIAATVRHEGPGASALALRVRQLEEQRRRTERERAILKNALAIFSQAT